jgi:hypothetical protein
MHRRLHGREGVRGMVHVTNMAIARQQLSKHVPAETDYWQRVRCWTTQTHFPWIRRSQCVFYVVRAEWL